MTAIALLSGGLDSTVAAAAHGGVRLAITADYGQRAAAREIAASRAIARALGIEHRVLPLPFLRELGESTHSALVARDRELPSPDAAALDDPAAAEASMRAVWVPNRNGLLVHAAACFAESAGCDAVVVGFNREEAKSFPDNSAEYLERATAALALSTRNGVRVESPTVALDKREIVRLGYQSNAPFPYIWSCYRGGAEHCWTCESCSRLKRALAAEDRLAQFLAEWRGAS